MTLEPTPDWAKCPKCRSPMDIMVQVTVIAPAQFESLFSKTNLRRKDFVLYGASWDTASSICKNDKCRYVHSRIVK